MTKKSTFKKQDEEKKKSEMTSQTQGGGSSPEDPDKKDKGYKPMPKWQKWGYIVSVIMMGGLTIANAVLFCKYIQVCLLPAKVVCKQEEYFKVPSESRPHLFLTKMAFLQYKLLCKKRFLQQ